tara:strand:- start:20 stop:943 length:924 start_codon:yes stop_codon:yes gene_type:complete
MSIKLNYKFFVYFFVLLIFSLSLLKILDLILQKKYGLGTPLIYKYSNVVGYIIEPNQKLRRLGNKIIINQEGMRSDNWKEDSPNNILFFGDSVTYGGSVVSNEDLFSERVCDNLSKLKKNNFSCGNYGVNGYSLDAISRKIKFNKNTKKANLIIVTLVANDLIRGFHHIISQPFWSKKIENMYPAITEAAFIYIDSFRYKTKYKFENELLENQIEYFEFIVESFSDILENTGLDYIVLYSPEKNELLQNPNKYFLIKNILKENINNFYDLSEYLNKEDTYIYMDGVHLNKKGHNKYSELISEIILSR